MTDPGWEEKKQTRNGDPVAGLIAEPTEPTGYGYALTCADSLPFTLKFPLSKTPTTAPTKSDE